MNVINRLAGAYETAEEKEAARIEAAKAEAIGEIPTAGKGALTFEEVDTFLTDNPDAEFFRIANKGSASGLERTERGLGRFNEPSLQVGQASIVSQSNERNSLNRYANISALERTGNEFADIPVDIRYKSSSFFSGQEYGYDAKDGMIFSREEYGNLKNVAARRGKKDGFLQAQKQDPVLPSDQLEDSNNTDNIDRQEFRGLGGEDESAVASSDGKAKRTLLG